ncbi:hypothetical protein [Providencia stuartii]|uniref:hypothetical protein n=1 Tax=Providencia stuartii TaxID=588 RepID=UPI001120582F|nr:hypothetical protein [Providencia stuartii]
MKRFLLTYFSPFVALFSPDALSDKALTAGYAKLIALSSTNDISASTLYSDGLDHSKYSLPYTFKNIYTDGDYAFNIQIRGNYLKVKSEVIDIDSSNSLRSRWDILNLTTSPQLTYSINKNYSLEGELELGYSNMQNKSSFYGEDDVKAGLREAKLLDWDINTLHITPKIGIVNKNTLSNGDNISLHTSIAYMFMESIGNKSNIKISNNIGIWSAGGEYTMTNAFDIKGKPFDIIVSNDIGGFYGNSYRDLSFGFINNTSLALETPININNTEFKIKAGVGYLSSDNAHGVTFIVGIN